MFKKKKMYRRQPSVLELLSFSLLGAAGMMIIVLDYYLSK